MSCIATHKPIGASANTRYGTERKKRKDKQTNKCRTNRQTADVSPAVGGRGTKNWRRLYEISPVRIGAALLPHHTMIPIYIYISAKQHTT